LAGQTLHCVSLIVVHAADGTEPCAQVEQAWQGVWPVTDQVPAVQPDIGRHDSVGTSQ
jgi:hypothetical protein